ncbi:ribosomal protein L25, Ctc-form [Rubrobacter radiotolerans]|uniref:Large ribosomal subunit protein bL25 n=1 Tax=Rubrobacter radiotolerans TaxID=42256 RepID=A0A023X1M5_RUBRA|nr:50S ribosomal protein L25 [Rubrobacter radiotolerans]AHY46071.1 ribosomal protein L25, Ctc-form [Rubrobacter radiotolerans]MDX5893481.1 50S ribosomal protein L25 [Rubrobacter radiotolerans]SMC03818.1 LSU ribosomal protein L25P [Rubrobacter radiotolerans DSM 5868]
MADNVQLQATEREGRGKNDSRRLRESGFTPAVLYAEGGNASLAVPNKPLDYTLTHYGDNALYDLDFGEGKQTARVVDVQRNPVNGKLLHVDFAPVNMREAIEVTVPLTLVGEAPGAEEGGVLAQVAYEVQVESLPGDIPQEIEVDVSGLGMNENLTLADITMPEGVTLISEPEEVVATITPPDVITEEDLEAAGVVEEESDEEATAREEAEGEEQAGDESVAGEPAGSDEEQQ